MDKIKPCDYCIEEECKGKRNCNCGTCSKRSQCVKVLHPTIRITKKCTQKCSHCLYECSPDCKEQMTIEMAQKISKFLIANDIQIITIMGGEFFCNPNWKEIVKVLCQPVNYCRLVTNGDWAKSQSKEVLETLSPFKNILKISISKDQWHTNQYVEKAVEACKEYGFEHNITTSEEDSTEAIIPIGRGEWHYSFFGSMSCYCSNPQHHYSFLIDEEGKIYKCSPGTWDYATIEEYLTGGFAKRFKEFNQKFYSIFIPSCKACQRVYQSKDSIHV